MNGVNKVIIIGNVGKDPEIRYTGDGTAIANFSVATSERWKDKAGEQQERTEWHRIVAFNKLAQIVADYVKKGTKVYIEGSIRTRQWENKEGQKQYTTEITTASLQMLSGKPEGGEPQAPQAPQQEPHVDFADDIPF